MNHSNPIRCQSLSTGHTHCTGCTCSRGRAWLARQAATAALEVDSSALFSLAASPASAAALSVTSAAVLAACQSVTRVRVRHNKSPN